MPNLNLKNETTRPTSSRFSNSSSSKVPIILGVIIGIAIVVFVLNQTGVLHLWGKKTQPHPQPTIVETPLQQPQSQPQIQPDTMGLTEFVSPSTPILEEKLLEREPISLSSTGNYTVQVSAWYSKSKAYEETKVFVDAGFPAFVQRRGTWYTVNIGRYETRDEANDTAEKMLPMLETGYEVVKVKN